MDSTTPCPCGSGLAAAACCEPVLTGDRPAATAEQLMRSRFTAFARDDAGYLRSSWHPTTCPRRIRLEPTRRWVRLEVLATTDGGLLDHEGTVEFRAHHEQDGQPGVLHEVSHFVRHEGRWVYLGAA